MDNKMIEVDEAYYKQIEKDSHMLECLDACGLPNLPIWDKAKAMYNEESNDEELDGYDDAKDVGYDY